MDSKENILGCLKSSRIFPKTFRRWFLWMLQCRIYFCRALYLLNKASWWIFSGRIFVASYNKPLRIFPQHWQGYLSCDVANTRRNYRVSIRVQRNRFCGDRIKWKDEAMQLPFLKKYKGFLFTLFIMSCVIVFFKVKKPL